MSGWIIPLYCHIYATVGQTLGFEFLFLFFLKSKITNEFFFRLSSRMSASDLRDTSAHRDPHGSLRDSAVTLRDPHGALRDQPACDTSGVEDGSSGSKQRKLVARNSL